MSDFGYRSNVKEIIHTFAALNFVQIEVNVIEIVKSSIIFFLTLFIFIKFVNL